MLMDCAAFKGWPFPIGSLKAQPNPHGAVTKWLKANRDRLGAFEGLWNCIDVKGAAGVGDPDLKLIHYSQMAHQPHLKYEAAGFHPALYDWGSVGNYNKRSYAGRPPKVRTA